MLSHANNNKFAVAAPSRKRHRNDVARRPNGGRTTSSRGARRRSGDDNKEEKTHEDWLNEADYSCIQDGRAVPPPAVINARHATSWAMYNGRPRLYTTYRCKWGYVPRPADSTGNLYCRRGLWVGTAPFCQRFGIGQLTVVSNAHSPISQ